MNKIGLYLHYPFCRQKCSYCDFYSAPCKGQEETRRYENAMVRHLRSLKEPLSKTQIDTVYFGGGTPSLCSPHGMKEIFSVLRSEFRLDENAEITCEMNPESAGKEILNAARECGVNRISLGMQSAVPAELETLGRIHTAKDVKKAVLLAKEAGFERISLDLMYGLPGQTLSSFLYSLDTAMSLEVEHISFYLLTLSEKTLLWNQREMLPDEETQRNMYLCAHEQFSKNGYFVYEISNACRKGGESRHNLRYWQGKEYFGLGPGAYSLWQNTRFSMTEDTQRFCSSSDVFSLLENREERSAEDLFTEYVMLSLRTAKGLEREKLISLSDLSRFRGIEEKMKHFVAEGLAQPTKEGYRLTPEGFFVSNAIILELI